MIELLAGMKQVDFVESKPARAIGTVGSGFEAFLIVDESVNIDALKAKFNKEIETQTKYAENSERKLSGNFAQHAPAELVEEEKKKLAECQNRIEKLKSYLQSL